jgi:hypothetical protein
MVVRFDATKLQANTSTDIGVESDPATKEKGAVSEVEMIVGEAKRHSGLASIPSNTSNALSDGESEELKQINEEQEPGPELTPEGNAEAEKILLEKNSQAQNS